MHLQALAQFGSRSFNRCLLLLLAFCDQDLFSLLCLTSLTISADDGLNENVSQCTYQASISAF